MSDKTKDPVQRVREIGRVLYRGYHGNAGRYGKELMELFPDQDNLNGGCQHEKMPDGAECTRCGYKP